MCSIKLKYFLLFSKFYKVDELLINLRSLHGCQCFHGCQVLIYDIGPFPIVWWRGLTRNSDLTLSLHLEGFFVGWGCPLRDELAVSTLNSILKLFLFCPDNKVKIKYKKLGKGWGSECDGINKYTSIPRRVYIGLQCSRHMYTGGETEYGSGKWNRGGRHTRVI